MLYLIAVAAIIVAAVRLTDGNDGAGTAVMMILGIIWAVIGWIPYLGLKVLKPQEALVLTLFGKYVGTIKDDGFYFVNPFCVSVNPAAKTKLRQSNDVDSRLRHFPGSSAENGDINLNFGLDGSDKKISLKIMTLNNNRQKINDCLGNPIEIGIAVMWRVQDTAKAVFDVDNYKEYLVYFVICMVGTALPWMVLPGACSGTRSLIRGRMWIIIR